MSENTKKWQFVHDVNGGWWLRLTSDEDIIRYIKATNDRYDGALCKAVHEPIEKMSLEDRIKTLKKAETKHNFICGTVISPIEVIDKLEWLKKNCKEVYFSNYCWFVPEEYWSDFIDFFENKLNFEKFALTDDFVYARYGAFIKGDKNRLWDYLAKNNEIEDTVFVDDVLPYLKYAEEKGVTAYHISSFIE